MSIISDPAGAHVAFWQAKQHIGAGLKSEPNTIHWCELLTSDPNAATAFYTELLGLESETMTMDQGGDYSIFLSGGMGVAGTMAMPEHLRERGIPAHWSVYFQVTDLDAVVGRAVANGANVGLPPTDIAMVGRIALPAGPAGRRLRAHAARIGVGETLLRSGLQACRRTWFDRACPELVEGSPRTHHERGISPALADL